MNIRQALTFAILMQNVMNKAPSYMTEKVFACTIDANPKHLLDSHNLVIFNEYCKRWKVEVK